MLPNIECCAAQEGGTIAAKDGVNMVTDLEKDVLLGHDACCWRMEDGSTPRK